MNRILVAAFTVALLCGGPASPSGAAQTTTANDTPGIAPGSVIPVQLTKTVDAKKVKTGDEVVAKVTVDLKNNAGTVIVPKDTKVVGHITEAQARSKDQKESEVAITFDRVVIRMANRCRCRCQSRRSLLRPMPTPPTQLVLSRQAVIRSQAERPRAAEHVRDRWEEQLLRRRASHKPPAVYRRREPKRNNPSQETRRESLELRI